MKHAKTLLVLSVAMAVAAVTLAILGFIAGKVLYGAGWTVAAASWTYPLVQSVGLYRVHRDSLRTWGDAS